jgi:putative DNA methylase
MTGKPANNEDKRLIEDYLPIEAISAEASREKSIRKGHISTLHLWWARRPLVACRAAVYGALVPADRWVKDVEVKNPPKDPAKLEAFKNGTKRGLNRKAAGEFVERLCKYPGDPRVIAQAQQHILDAHAARLTQELEEGKKAGKPPAWAAEFKWPKDKAAVTRGDIEAGRAPRPRVLDMFAGGGAIPLEALRLGCEAYALDLNPVAHIIELCTLVYPQKYGRPDPNARGMTGPPGKDGKPTWGGLAEEVRYWGNWVLEKVRAEIGDLYPPIPDPKAGKARRTLTTPQMKFAGKGFDRPGQQELHINTPIGYLTPVACLWTRTVRCKNPACGATVPLVKQTWLCKKKGHYVALKMIAPRGTKQVRFEVVEAEGEDGFGFDPADLSEAGNATCPFCGTVADAGYTQAKGVGRQVGAQLLAVVCRKSDSAGTSFLSPTSLPEDLLPSDDSVRKRIRAVQERSGITLPGEAINPTRPSPNARGMTAPTRHGLTAFADLFHPRQLLSLLVQCEAVQSAFETMSRQGLPKERTKAIATYLGIIVDRMADRGNSLCRWDPGRLLTQSAFGRPAVAFVWDFSEANPFGDASGDMSQAIEWVCRVISEVGAIPSFAEVERGSALALPRKDGSIDAVVTDPPYYDNVPYADVSDFFYVWLKRTIGHLYAEHFATDLTPKKNEATALSSRHKGDMAAASAAYEEMMLSAFKESHRVLKDTGELAIVYAHKTTLGWATLVDALRKAGFVITEAWPLDTEFGGRLIALDASALASSIFLVGRKREGASAVGNYEETVRPELDQIVRERVDALWEMGISGADLVIAAVGAGLRAFTKYDKVEYANGEEVPAEKFLAEVEGVVLDAMMAKLIGATGGSVSAVDPPSRFYTLWRYVYKAAEIDAGEAIVFTYSQHVELDGPQGLSAGKDALVEKKKSKYRALDFTERGKYEKLGLPRDDGQPAPLVDVLHRVLWLMENEPRKLGAFLDDARPDRERLRVLAQALAGPGLSGKSEKDAARLLSTTLAEQAALSKLLANWKSLVPEALYDQRYTHRP